jgi:hypothetical protein
MMDKDELAYRRETVDHVTAVMGGMMEAIENLQRRMEAHDASKFEEPEMSGFMAMTADARLQDLVYDSEEYRAVLREHQPTIQHHYAMNDHHPEHYGDAGINGMSLLAMIEMLCDWKASTGRMKDGDLVRSIEQNQKRFFYSEEVKNLILNTAQELGMMRKDKT